MIGVYRWQRGCYGGWGQKGCENSSNVCISCSTRMLTDCMCACVGAQLLEAVRELKPACTSEPAGFQAERLAAALRARGYLAALKQAQPRESCGAGGQGRCGRTCLERLQHAHVLVTGSLDSSVTVRAAHAHAEFAVCGCPVKREDISVQ